MKIISTMKSDWINSHPIFFNIKTKSVSTNINDVVEWGNFEFDSEGLFNYLKFGYLIFDKTVFKDVFRLPHSSTINVIEENGIRSFAIEEGEDEIFKYLKGSSTPDECLGKIEKHVNNFEKTLDGKRILLPLSGGHDSRLLFSMIKDKSKIDAITYDISLSLKYSHESLCSFILTNEAKVKWENILVNKYFTKAYCERNFNLFGLEMPIHASYHMEMYDQAQKLFDLTNSIVVSGSVGDWWSGEKVPLAKTKTWEDAERLFFNHNISIPEEYILCASDRSYNENIIKQKLEYIIESDVYRTVFSRRGRVGLSGFIVRAAESFLPVYNPFYDIDIAASQMHLNAEERQDRIWQKKYFDKIGMGAGLSSALQFAYSSDNSQDLQAMAHALRDEVNFISLNENDFENIVDTKRIIWINCQLETIKKMPISFITHTSNRLYGLDNSQFPRGVSGHHFEKVCSSSLNLSDVNKAIWEWSVLAPLQMAMNVRKK
jgi:hypothetical protein